VGDSGFEPLTSSASRKRDRLLGVSHDCRTPANQAVEFFYNDIVAKGRIKDLWA
jgi:hypothetical protein